MRLELDEALCRDFPNTFRDRHGKPEETSMCWGFPGDGWEPIIRRAAEKIEAAILKLPAKKQKSVTSAQVKEKFGVLRWYMTPKSKAVDAAIGAAIHEAGRESAVTCETCGAPGTTKGTKGWYLTLCVRCRRRKRAAR